MYELAGVSMTASEVRMVTEDMRMISADVEEIMKSFDETMSYLCGSSEGGIIQKVEQTVKELYSLVETLLACLIDLGAKIGKFLDVILNHDSEGAAEILEAAHNKSHNY